MILQVQPSDNARVLRKQKQAEFHQADTSNSIPFFLRVSEHIVDHPAFIAVTTALTVYALIGDDLRLICTDKADDPTFNGVVLWCILVFSAEIVISCIGKADYFLGFFFWLDAVSTASLVLDLTWVTDSITEGANGQDASDMRSGRTARLGAKAGRVVRVLRLVRILKLYKNYSEAAKKRDHSPVLGHARPGVEEDELDDVDIEFHRRNQESPHMPESRVGKKLSDITTRRVVCLILAMLLVLPTLRSEAVDQTARSSDYGAEHVLLTFKAYEHGHGSREAYEQAMLRYIFYHNWFAGTDPQSFCQLSGKGSMAGNSCSDAYYGHLFWLGISGRDAARVLNRTQAAALSQSTVSSWSALMAGPQGGIYNYGTMPPGAQALLHSSWDRRCDTGTQTRWGLSLLKERISGVVDSTAQCPHDLRSLEVIAASPRLLAPSQMDSWHFIFYFDVRSYVRRDSKYNLLVTLFVMVLLIVGSMMFAHDASSLVLRPVEKMVQRVEAIRDNPLIAMKMADDEFQAEEIAKALMKRDVDRGKRFLQDLVTCSMCDAASGEPLETVILEKTIIKLGSLLALGFGEAGANIIAHNMKRTGVGINAMIPGTVVNTIIGVVRVRDFSVTTEVLQARINAFCNQIAEIVHGVCDEFHGAPNRNNGESFLVIWRLEDIREEEPPPPRNACMAEMSVVAFATILGCVHQSPLLADYRSHPAMQNRLGRDCRVSLSFGLHAGWAIEGAVGSEFKIDASYLSPNVSLATSIERATEAYGVSLMVGQSVMDLAGQELPRYCRLIDRVSVPGSSWPTRLYCVDLDDARAEVDRSRPPRVAWNARQRFKVRQYMDAEKRKMLEEDYDALALFRTDPVIAAMRSPFTEEFLQLYKMGYQNYSEGEWQVASRLFSSTRFLLGMEDGPSSSLLSFMASHGNEAPETWQGFRPLASDLSWLSSGLRRNSARALSVTGSFPCLRVPL